MKAHILFTVICVLSDLLACRPGQLHAQAPSAENLRQTFQSTIPVVRPNPRLTPEGETRSDRDVFYPRWVPNEQQYVQLEYKQSKTDRSRSIEIRLHDRAGHTLQARQIDTKYSDIFDFAVLPSGAEVTVGLAGKTRALQSFSLPNLTLQWEKQLPDDEFFNIITPHGILTSNSGQKNVYDPHTGTKLSSISNTLLKGSFDNAAENGFVNFTPTNCLVYIEGVSNMDDAAETPEGITVHRLELTHPDVTQTSLTLESPRRKRAYSGYNAVKYDPQSDTLHMGSRTGSIDVFDTRTGQLIRSIRVQAPDAFDLPADHFNLPIPLPTNVSARPLVLCVHGTESSGVLCSVDDNNKAIPLIRADRTKIRGLHPTLPLAFFESNCIFNIGILDYQSSKIDGAILAQQQHPVGNANSLRNIFANQNTIWTRANIYDPRTSNLCEVAEWSLLSGEKLGSFQVRSSPQDGGFSATEGRCLLTSNYEVVEVSTTVGVNKTAFNDGGLRAACTDSTSFYFAREMKGHFDLMSARQGETSLVMSIRGYDIGYDSDLPLATEDGNFAMSGCRRKSVRGSVVDQDHYILVVDRDTESVRSFKQQGQISSMVWIGGRLVIVQGDKVTWYDDPFNEDADLGQDDGQIAGLVSSVHKLNEDLVVVSEHNHHLIISVCNWEDEGLIVKTERRIPNGTTRSASGNGVAVSDGCFFYQTASYVIATRIAD